MREDDALPIADNCLQSIAPSCSHAHTTSLWSLLLARVKKSWYLVSSGANTGNSGRCTQGSKLVEIVRATIDSPAAGRHDPSMTPDEALAKQIELYRAMTGEERLAIALRLHDLACDIARAGIRAQHPGADEGEVNRLLRERIALSREE